MRKTEKGNQKQLNWNLPDLLNYAKILGVSEVRLSDDLTMRESKKIIEKRILEEIHPYKIYDNSKVVPGQWATHLPDPTRPRGRRFIRRNSYERICQAVIEFYLEQEDINMNMQTLYEQWLIFRRDQTSAKPGTIRKDASMWNTYIKDAVQDKETMAAMKVKDVTTKVLYRYFRTLTKDRQYTKQTVTNIRSVLNGMFNYAVEQEVVEHNPVRDIDFKRLPYKPVPNKSNDVFTHEDATTLMTYLEPLDDPYALAIRLDFNLFIRVGELAGLKWENIDFKNQTAYICHQITYEPELDDDLNFKDKKMVTEDYLKGCTSQGFRTEHLREEAIEILKRAREINPDGEFVFMPFGKPIITTTFNKRLKKYCEAAGVPYHSSHKIRFYVCSTAYNGENLPQVSKMMGHSQTSTTLHYLRDVNQDETCADVFAKLGNQ